MAKFWIGVVSKEHVLRGVEGGFCQVCHGKKGPLNRMKKGDYLLYYSPKYQMKSLNEFGIPFLHPKGNRKFPLVLRSDGDKILKGEKVQPITQTKERRRSAVLS